MPKVSFYNDDFRIFAVYPSDWKPGWWHCDELILYHVIVIFTDNYEASWSPKVFVCFCFFLDNLHHISLYQWWQTAAEGNIK